MNFETICQFPVISGWSEKFIGVTLTQRQLARRTGDLLRALGHPVMVHCGTDRNVDKNTVVISAEYDVNRDESGKKRYMSLTLVTNPKSVSKITFDSYQSANYSLDIIEALCHEYQHQHQYRSREFSEEIMYASKDSDYDVQRQQEYLGTPGEIDAFAVNIAIRLWLLHGTAATSRLGEMGLLNYDESPDLWGYSEVFGVGHAVVKRLARKIAKNLNLLADWKLKRIEHWAVSDNQFAL